MKSNRLDKGVWWKRRISDKFTWSDSGRNIDIGDVYYVKNISYSSVQSVIESTVLTEKEYFVYILRN